MKSIKDILGRKKTSSESNIQIEGDEKTIIGISKGIVISEVKNLSSEDIQDMCYKKKKLIIKTVHPAVASEVWRKRERLKKAINDFLGADAVQEIKVK